MWDRSIALLLFSLFLVNPLLAQTIDEGQQLFEAQCSACHTIGGGQLVGPDLKGVTERREAKWVEAHVEAPSVQREQNDPAALALVEKYGTVMPDLGLTVQEVKAVVAYLAASTPATGPALHPLYIPTLVLAALAVVGLTLTGLIAGKKRVWR